MSDGPPWLDPGSRFPATRVSVVERLRSPEPLVRDAAFGQLVAGYWKPIYKYARLKWALAEADAEDATQAFLAAAWEKSFFDAFDPAKARFRTFLRVCLDRFVMNRKQAERALRRGGGMEAVPLDFAGAEGEIARAASVADGVDGLFRQEMIRELFSRALIGVREECERNGRMIAFQVFEAYDVLAPDGGVTYADLARRFDVPATQVTNYLASVRRLFRTHALDALHGLCGSEAEYRAEARELFGVEVE